MLLVEILWVSLVLGGLIASLWPQLTWRGTWYRLARARVPSGAGTVWQRSEVKLVTGPPGLGPWPTPEVITRAGPSPRPIIHGCGILSAPGARPARRANSI
jgi:hypothetical protein